MPLSHSKSLLYISTLFATLSLGFGINALISPPSALSVFEFQPPHHPLPSTPSDTAALHAIIQLYGARDIFMALAQYAGIYYAWGNGVGAGGARKVLGWCLLGVAATAGVDGWVVKGVVGRGEWNHWGYAPACATVGGLLIGILD